MSAEVVEVVEVRLPVEGARRAGPVVGALCVVGLAALAAVLALVATDAGQPTWAVLFGTLAVVLLLVLGGYLAASAGGRRGRLRVRHDAAGLEVVGSPWPSRATLLAGVVAAAGTVAGAVVLAGDDDGRDVTATGPVVVLAVLALAALWPGVRFATGRRPVDALRLTRSGFTARTRGHGETFSWGDVTGFAVGLGGLTVTLIGHGETVAPVPASELRSDAGLVAELLEYYRAHERDRAELTSGAALARVREGTFR